MSVQSPKKPDAKGILKAHREAKRLEAEERQAARDARTAQAQLALLAGRRGDSKRERARLEKP